MPKATPTRCSQPVRAQLKVRLRALARSGVHYFGGVTVAPTPSKSAGNQDVITQSLCRVLDAHLKGQLQPLAPLGDKHLTGIAG